MIISNDEQQMSFGFELSSPGRDSPIYREGALDLLKRIAPKNILDDEAGPLARGNFLQSIPYISFSDHSKAPCSFSVLILAKHRPNAMSFFYDMISRWLIPSKKVNVDLFFTSDIRLPHLTDELLSVGEIVLSLKSVRDVEEVKKNLEIIERELRLGLVSSYHATRILEFKGLSSDGKTALIQEKIHSLIQSHSQDFDHGIFTHMQQFLVNTSNTFKENRDYHHISRIISNLYSLKKLLKHKVDLFPSQRHVALKFLKTQLPGKRRFLSPFDTRGSAREGTSSEGKHVLGLLVGINFLQEHEVFEKEHLVSAIQKQLPCVELVSDSLFQDRSRDLQTLYLEVKKPEGKEFSLQEVQALRTSLADQVKGRIEQLVQPIFMPRNEEELLRNIMLLSRQLRFAKDLPQVVISFDEQRGEDLYFTVVLVRVQPKDAPTIQEEFMRSVLPYIPDRVRMVGHVRKKYVKEASVFRTSIKHSPFLREDRSVDLYKARQAIFNELEALIGKIRDFNGGMISKQFDLSERLKKGLGVVARRYPVLLEKFYYSLEPIEARTAMDIEDLKELFLLFLSRLKQNHKDFLYKQNEKKFIAVAPVDSFKQKVLMQRVSDFSLPLHQLGTFSIDVDGLLYFGCILHTEDLDLQARVLRSLE